MSVDDVARYHSPSCVLNVHLFAQQLSSLDFKGDQIPVKCFRAMVPGNDRDSRRREFLAPGKG